MRKITNSIFIFLILTNVILFAGKVKYITIPWGNINEKNKIYLNTYGEQSTLEWGYPTIFDIDKNGYIYIPDEEARAIKGFKSPNQLIKFIDLSKKWKQNPILKFGIDYNNNIIFWDANKNFTKINANTEKIIFKKENFKRPGAILFDDENNIYTYPQCFSPDGKELNFDKKANLEKNKNIFNKPDQIIEKNFAMQKKLKSGKVKLSKTPKKILLEINDKNKPTLHNKLDNFHYELINKIPNISEEMKKKFINLRPGINGKSKTDGTYWEWHAYEYKALLVFYMNAYGQITDYIYEDYSEYLEMKLKVGKDGNLYSYTPHKTDGVIIWKYTFEE